MFKRIGLSHCILSTVLLVQLQNLLLRDPAINPNGSLVSFSYQGEIWTVPASGVRGTRLSIQEAYADHQRDQHFSPPYAIGALEKIELN